MLLSPALLALAAIPAFASDPPPSAGAAIPDSPPIVVTGIRTQQYRDRLAACLARNCPPDEDIDATLALAEAQFLNGEYEDGRSVVRASIGRNRRHAGRYPEPVSDLYRAHARFSRHLGFDDSAAQSTYSILRSLRAGLPQEDHRHFTARLEIATLQMTMGNANRARRELRELARIARASGREDVATLAELREIWFDYAVDRHGDAKARLIALSEAGEPGLRRTGARVLLARIFRAEGDEARSDALLAEVGQGVAQRRRLIYSPDYVLPQQEVTNALDLVLSNQLRDVAQLGNTIHRLPDDHRDTWIDVGFWVMPDGRVEGLEVVRRNSRDAWAEPLLESIRGRLYSTADEPTYRLERYTYTARLERATGTLLRRHGPDARIEYMDLTANAAPPPPTPGN